jgi:hypothetical protein
VSSTNSPFPVEGLEEEEEGEWKLASVWLFVYMQEERKKE